MVAPGVVQAVPVAATPLGHKHVLWVHIRLDDKVQADVSIVPAPQGEEQSIHNVSECELES